MSSEREIVKRLWESRDYEDEREDDLDEKTYTVGDTQYWRRGSKCYKWTSSEGRTECSEDEYMKAISGGSDNSTGNSGSVKNTDSKDDKSNNQNKDTADSIASDWKFVKDIVGVFPDRTSTGQQFTLSSTNEVTKAHRDLVSAIKDKGLEAVSEKVYEYKGDIARMQGGKFKVTTFKDVDGNEFSVRSRVGGKEKQIVQLHKGTSDLGDSWVLSNESDVPEKLSNPSIEDVDKALISKFPYDSESDYETVGSVDWVGDGSDRMRLSVPHIGDTRKVMDYLKDLGASKVDYEPIRNRHGKYDLLYFKFD